MTPNFSPSLEYVLTCPRRFYLEKVRRERTLAPFAASTLGIQVHRRMAHSLRSDTPADESPFRLPRRLLLQEGEALDDLTWRARTALTFFNTKCRVWLSRQTTSQVEHYITKAHYLGGAPITVSGILDLVLTNHEEDVLIDWKTGSAAHSEDQLKFYLVLRYLETGKTPHRAEAISLSSGESLCVAWEEGLLGWFGAKLQTMQRKLETCRAATPEPSSPKAGGHCKYCPYAHTCEQSEAPKRYMLDTFTGEVTRL